MDQIVLNPKTLIVALGIAVSSGTLQAAGHDVTFNNGLFLPTIPAQQSGSPVCVDDSTGQLVSNCDAATGGGASTGASFYLNEAWSDSPVPAFSAGGYLDCVVGPHVAGDNETALMSGSTYYSATSQQTITTLSAYTPDGLNWHYCPAQLYYPLVSNPAGGYGNIISDCRLDLTPGGTYEFALITLDYSDVGFTAPILGCQHLVQVVPSNPSARNTSTDDANGALIDPLNRAESGLKRAPSIRNRD